MSEEVKEPARLPWYRRHGEYMERARGYLRGWADREWELPVAVREEVHAYRHVASIRLIFESNLIEGAGLSEGDTRTVVEKYFPRLPINVEHRPAPRRALPDLSLVDPATLEGLLQRFQEEPPPPEAGTGSLRFRGRSRATREVTQHYQAFLITMRLGRELEARPAIIALAEFFLRASPPGQPPLWQREPRWIGTRHWHPMIAAILDGTKTELSEADRALITIREVQALHATLAEGLLPADAGVSAGEFRIDERTAGLHVKFPSPSLVPAAMHEWERRTNARLPGPGGSIENAVVAHACAISYDFVRTHPFPDFNGRLSRLLLNAVLVPHVPFPVVLSGRSKENGNYLRALKMADRGDMRGYETLVAMSICASFEEVNENLRLAGLPVLMPK